MDDKNLLEEDEETPVALAKEEKDENEEQTEEQTEDQTEESSEDSAENSEEIEVEEISSEARFEALEGRIQELEAKLGESEAENAKLSKALDGEEIALDSNPIIESTDPKLIENFLASDGAEQNQIYKYNNAFQYC